MGEVYRARDTRLDRTVAVKILPPALATDPAFRDRFAREARTISALDHPHICALHDVGEQDGIAFLVMPFLDGETLADRLRRGALPVDEATTIAEHIAAALEAAHERGIVHRDLKPGNIIVSRDGAAKVLDFGLAKDLAPASPDLSMSPTVLPSATRAGMIVGTVAYMAPEQARGAQVDKRADIWAFGCVLYEMLAGRA
ncbi:MAG TPA: serine/threonine-protein kinase, partial [Gemmatimonadaceae bacterium]